MKIKTIFFVTLLCALVSAQIAFGQEADQEAGEVIFCASIDDQHNPVGVSAEFDTNEISLILNAKPGESFGALNAVLSVYTQMEDGKETLLHRETASINPEWNVLIIEDIPLPEIGKYLFALTSTDGKIFSRGVVTIKEKAVEKEMPEKIPMEGFNLEDIFNRYRELATTPK
jgi:hypothetical protein